MPGPITLEVARLDTPRPGLRVITRDAEGREGSGEGFPLPGRSQEDLEAASEWLHTLSLEGDPLDHAREAASVLGPDLPVTTFALESALLELASVQREQPIWRLLRGGDPEDEDAELEAPAVNALLPEDAELPELLAAAEAALETGHRTLKLKLGRRDFNEDLERLRCLREEVGPGVALRADANGAWTPEETPNRLFALGFLGLEFLEQPVPAAKLADLPPSRIAIGADESLADPAEVERLLTNRRAQVWVLKPGALGIRRTLVLATRARAEGLEVVITHAADGPVALERARAVARALAPFDLACGLAG